MGDDGKGRFGRLKGPWAFFSQKSVVRTIRFWEGLNVLLACKSRRPRFFMDNDPKQSLLDHPFARNPAARTYISDDAANERDGRHLHPMIGKV